MLDIFRVLRDRELRALWFADWINDAGSFITFIALAVYINNLTGSATAVGFALALRTIPWFTIGPFAGVLVDRLDRRSVMIGTCLIRAVLVGVLPFTHAAWQAYVLSFSSSLFGPLFRPARSALLAQVAPEGKLVPSLSVLETTHQVLHTIDPAIGGLAVLPVGARHAFFLAAAAGVGCFALAWFEPSFVWLGPIAFACGLADSGAGSPMAATLAEQLSDEFRGRAYAVVNGLIALADAAGSLGFAWLGETGR